MSPDQATAGRLRSVLATVVAMPVTPFDEAGGVAEIVASWNVPQPQDPS